MDISSFRSTSSSFGPGDFNQSQSNAIPAKLSSASEISLESLRDKKIPAEIEGSEPKPEGEELRKAFQDFVGQTFFSQMISAMRSTQDGAAYFDGGRAEKIFQGQLDQVLSEKLSEASASKISDPMFKLFQLRRQ